MSTNAKLAEVFGEMAAVLQITGASVFKVNAHERVARILRDLPSDVATLADDESKLTAIEGIGAGSAKKITEFVRTGAVREHAELLASIPKGLLDVLAISGLGPKTVKLLWEKGGVTDLPSLQAKLDSGELEGLPRMGKKTLENIRESLQFAARSAKRIRLGQALPLAEAIVERLADVDGVETARCAGSLRRGRETIGDVDVLVATRDPDPVSEAFRSMPEVAQVLVSGSTKVSVRLEQGVQVDLRMVEPEVFGAAWLYFSGSKEHNVLLRERAIGRRLRLNEYGLFPDDGTEEGSPQSRGVAPVAAATEEEIYAALDLPWIPPELREARGEMDATLPALIEAADVRSELHAHTVASDGKLTIDELAAAAMARGRRVLAITDHSQASIQANGLSPERLRKHVRAIREANDRIEGITLLAGSEVDILADGRLDYDDDLLAELDVVVASPHVALRQDADRATERLLRAIEHPLVHIIGHPTGRIINRREGLSPDVAVLVAAAAEHGTALEINANFLRLDLRDAHVRAAVDGGALIAINTDAHAEVHLDYLRYGIMTARRGWLTAAGCVNTWTEKKLRAWLGKKR